MDLQSNISLHTGATMPALGLGTWQIKNDVEATINSALELGYRLIDTSSDYGSQFEIGQAIKNTTIDRKDLYITTKVEETDQAYEATKTYLAEMDLEYADLILIHRPPVAGAGEQLWKDLIKAKQQGLTKDIGVSNYSATLIQQLIDSTGEVPTINQVEWSPFGHSKELMDYCKSQKIVIQAYSPLTHAKRFGDSCLRKLISKYNKSAAQILIRWNLQLGIVPLPKASQKNHLEENINVFDFEISNEDMEFLENQNQFYSSLGSLAYI